MAEGVAVEVAAPWRIVCEDRIAFASGDDGQAFGLPVPVDGLAKACERLAGRRITAVALDEQTADLTLRFDAATRVDVFNNSMGYEGWQATYAVAGRRWSLIAMGGGGVTSIAA